MCRCWACAACHRIPGTEIACLHPVCQLPRPDGNSTHTNTGLGFITDTAQPLSMWSYINPDVPATPLPTPLNNIIFSYSVPPLQAIQALFPDLPVHTAWPAVLSSRPCLIITPAVELWIGSDVLVVLRTDYNEGLVGVQPGLRPLLVHITRGMRLYAIRLPPSVTELCPRAPKPPLFLAGERTLCQVVQSAMQQNRADLMEQVPYRYITMPFFNRQICDPRLALPPATRCTLPTAGGGIYTFYVVPTGAETKVQCAVCGRSFASATGTAEEPVCLYSECTPRNSIICRIRGRLVDLPVLLQSAVQNARVVSLADYTRQAAAVPAILEEALARTEGLLSCCRVWSQVILTGPADMTLSDYARAVLEILPAALVVVITLEASGLRIFAHLHYQAMQQCPPNLPIGTTVKGAAVHQAELVADQSLAVGETMSMVAVRRDSLLCDPTGLIEVDPEQTFIIIGVSPEAKAVLPARRIDQYL